MAAIISVSSILILLMCLVAFTVSQICLNIGGPCIAGKCLTGEKCIEDVCCVTNASQNCDNTLDDSFCDSHVQHCHDPLMKDTMAKQCARTCMKCEELNKTSTTAAPPAPIPTQSSCADIEKDCAKYAYLCLNIHYFDFLTQYCGKTCNRCNYVPQVHPHHGHCIDKTKPDGTSDCPSEVSLCNDPVYHDLMTYECPKTCGRC